jgi:hypothetical protein
VNSSFFKFATAAGCLAGLACVIEPLASSRNAERRENFDGTPHFQAEQASVSVLAGFRGLAADIAWLRGYLAWEQQDVAKTESSIELAAALDGRPLCFWVNGARIIAYDMPAWATGSSDATGVGGDRAQTTIEEKYAWHALAHLEKAQRRHPRNAALLIERANIEFNRLRDPLAAARSYRLAAELPNAPYYAARLHAEMLHRAGRASEALVWLKELYPKLPKHVEAACASTVLERIRSLERELSVSKRDRFIESHEADLSSISL